MSTKQLRTQLKNSNSILKKVRMVTSNRDGRIGFILSNQNGVVEVKMEGIVETIKFNEDKFPTCFSFSFSKDEMINAVYMIKSARRVIPRLHSMQDVYVSSIFIYDYLERFFDDVTNEEIFSCLNRLKISFENR